MGEQIQDLIFWRSAIIRYSGHFAIFTKFSQIDIIRLHFEEYSRCIIILLKPIGKNPKSLIHRS